MRNLILQIAVVTILLKVKHVEAKSRKKNAKSDSSKNRTSSKRFSEVEVIRELQHVVRVIVEPAIQILRTGLIAKGDPSECFYLPGSAYLRRSCCTQYTALAGALLERAFGTGQAVYDGEGRAADPILMRKLTTLSEDVDVLTHVPAFEELHFRQQRWGNVGPVHKGIYSAELVVAGVRGMLVKCEFGSVHTFLMFVPARGYKGIDEPLLVDTTYKQMLVISDWMEADLYDLVEELRFFSDLSEHFVGNASTLQHTMSLALRRQTTRTLMKEASMRGLKSIEQVEAQMKAKELPKQHRLIEKMYVNKEWQGRVCGRVNT